MDVLSFAADVCSGRCLEAREADAGLEFRGQGLMFSEAGADETEQLSAGRFRAAKLWPKASLSC
jgi:hypothetical protein